MKNYIDDIEKSSELLKILGDRTRLTIFSLLKIRELCVCELTALLDVSQPAISQHLRKLKLLNIVKERKQGQWVYYSLRQPEDNEKMLQAVTVNLPDVGELIARLNEEETSCKVEEIKSVPNNSEVLTYKK